MDNYECWISLKQHTRLSESSYKKLKKEPSVFSAELVQVIGNKNSGTHFPITIGSMLPSFKNKECALELLKFSFEGHTSNGAKRSARDIIQSAYLFMNAPYLWGGRTPFGIDCSGFTQLVFRLNGYPLPRDAYQQVETGTPLSFVEEAEPGDLAFFDNEEGRIVHVGILLDKEQIIHASGFVRIDKFDHYGIYNSEKKGYSHTLRVIKRLL